MAGIVVRYVIVSGMLTRYATHPSGYSVPFSNPGLLVWVQSLGLLRWILFKFGYCLANLSIESIASCQTVLFPSELYSYWRKVEPIDFLSRTYNSIVFKYILTVFSHCQYHYLLYFITIKLTLSHRLNARKSIRNSVAVSIFHSV